MPNKPSKLETLRKERDKLKAKGTLTRDDDRRLQNLSRMIREEESKLGSFAAATSKYSSPGTTPLQPWRSASTGAYRSVDKTASYQTKTRDQLRLAFGMPGIVNTFMTMDEDTGELSVNPQFADYRFGKTGSKIQGSAAAGVNDLALRAYIEYGTGRDVTAMNGMSVKNMLDFYYSMDDAELIKFQTEMVEAGLLEKPQLGTRDPSTNQALEILMKTWMTEPNQDIQDLLGRLKKANSARLDEAARKMLGENMGGTGVVSDQVARVEVTDSETLDSMIDKLSMNLFGQFVDPEQKQALINQLQEEERSRGVSDAQANFNMDVKNAQNQAKAASGGNELDAFMDALIGKESGADPNAVNPDSGAMGLGQIMPENWAPWAAEAGADPRDFSAANQRKVIKYKLAQYYQNYGNWRDVALAWYGGAGGVARAHAGGGNSTEYYGGNAYDSLNQYADSVIAKMNGGIAQNLQSGGGTPQLTIDTREQLAGADVRAEAALKRLNPELYAGKQFENHAENFFALIGGVN